MTNHPTALGVATEVRAEMARQRKTQGDLAKAIGVNEHTVGRRLRAEVPFDVVELVQVADWLGVPLEQLWPTSSASEVAS